MNSRWPILIILLFDILFCLYKIFILIYYQDYVSKVKQILFNITFAFMSLFYIFRLLLYIPCRINFINEIKNKIKDSKTTKYIIFFIVFVFWIFQYVMIILYFIDLQYYKINCPFSIADELSEHYKKRCELYNINNNSRYLNQYICSYDPTKDFRYETVSYGKYYYQNKDKRIEKEIKDDFLVCVSFNKEIEDNQIVASFCQEYIKEKKYYCSRTNQPKKNFKVDDKNCKSIAKYVGIIIIIVLMPLESCYILLALVLIDELVYSYIDSEINYNNNNANVNPNPNVNKADSTLNTDNMKNENDISFEKKKTINVGLDKDGVLSVEPNIVDFHKEQPQSNTEIRANNN